MALYFSDYFEVSQQRVERYGAFDVSLESDLPLFIDPFLLFNSDKPKYQKLHDSIIRYLKYLRDRSVAGNVDEGALRYLYCFGEVRQNWLGFTYMGNGGSGLGMAFARALDSSLQDIFADFGSERITRGSHLEKVALIKPGVGRDNISDFVTNLIKHYLLKYTQRFAMKYIDRSLTEEFRVPKVKFNYSTESWMEGTYSLPTIHYGGKRDFVLLTPSDILTRDDTWINSTDLLYRFHTVPEAISDGELRSQVSSYFAKRLGESTTQDERVRAAIATIREYPVVVDYYIRHKEDDGDEAADLSGKKVKQVRETYRSNAEEVVQDLVTRTEFYTKPVDTYADALDRVRHFKHYIENQDGYKLINSARTGLAGEKSVQLYFGLIWYGTPFDVNREPNNGRGPVDFKISAGAADKSLIEFKLGSNSHLKRNLQRQVEIYKKANDTRRAVKVIVCYTANDQSRVQAILDELGLGDEESVVVIDARKDNKPSASKA